MLPIVLAGAARLAVFAAIRGVIRLANVAHHPAELGQFAGILGRAIFPEAVLAWTTSNEGMTALHVAVRSRNASLVRYLLDKGARADIKDASGRTPLDVLNGVPAYQPAVFADHDGVVPPNPNAAAATAASAGRGAGDPAAVEEIRALLNAVR